MVPCVEDNRRVGRLHFGEYCLERSDDFFFLGSWCVALDLGKTNFEEQFVSFVLVECCFFGDAIAFGMGYEYGIEWMRGGLLWLSVGGWFCS